ncbi:MAG: hypothetical protein AB7I38_11580 [Dehalococcoidia bacterium]
MAEIDPRQAFAEQLTLLWVEAGRPTYTALARQAQNRLAARAVTRAPSGRPAVTKQRISDWRTGKQVPRDFMPVSAVIGALLVDARSRRPTPVVEGLYDAERWRLLWQRAADASARRGGKSDATCAGGVADVSADGGGVEQPCPYRGLAPFEVDDVGYYFGRSRAVAELAGRVAALVDTGGLLMLVAPSGAGKSSLLAAGLIPAVRAGQLGIPEAVHWPVIQLTPGTAPLAALAEHLPSAHVLTAEAGPAPLSELRQRLRAEAAALAGGGPAARILLVVDQFEELFTQAPDAERQLFVAALDAVAAGPAPPAVVVVGLRADFYSHCLEHPPLVDALQHRHVVLRPMTVKELTAVITEPAKAAGLRLEPSLAELIIQDAGVREVRAGEDADAVAGVLPLLSHALRATWQHRTGGRLTLAGYRGAGGIRGAVTQTAERALADLDPPTQDAAMSLLLQLTRIGEEHSQDSRRQRGTRELVDEAPDPAAARRALEALVRARLVRVDAETAQIIHEALLRAWPRLRGRIEQHRAALLGLQRLEDDARLWDGRGRDSSRLYRGEHLVDAEGWADSGDLGGPGPSALARDFLAAAAAARDQQRAERTRRRARARHAWSAIAALAAFSLVIALIAAAGWRNASRHEDDASFASLLASADRFASSDPSLSAQLALIAHELRPDDPREEGRVLSTQHVPHPVVQHGQHGAVYFVDHSPDGRLLATATEGGIVQIHDGADPASPVLDEVVAGPSWLSTALFHPSLPRLASAGSDATVRLWDVHDPRQVEPAAEPVPIGHAEISQLAWSPDGQLLVTANGDHTLSILTGGNDAALVPAAVVALPGRGIVRAVTFAGESGLFAVAGDDGRLVLLRHGPGQLPEVVGSIEAHSGPIQSLAWSPDGTVLASGSADKTVRLWTVEGGGLAPLGAPLAGHTATVWSMAWRDPSTLITAAKDGAARIWNVANPALPSVVRTMPTATGGLLAISLAPGAGRLVGGGQDGSTLTWDLPSTVLTDRIPRVSAIALSPDRRWLATGAGTTTVRLWDLRDPTHPVRTGPPDIGDAAYARTAIAWSADGHTLATQGGDFPLRIWDVTETGAVTLLATVAQQTGYSAAVAISPSGQTLVTGAAENLVAFDIRDRAHPVRLPDPPRVHRSYLTSALFAGGGNTLVTTSNDGTAQVWDLTDPQCITPLGSPHEFGAGQIFAAALSPDSQTLAVAGTDNTVRFWDRAGGGTAADRAVLTGFDAPPSTLSWSPDGDRLATGGTDQIVRVWRDPTGPGAAAVPLTGHIGGVNKVLWRDEHTLVSAGEDQLVLVWDLDLAAQKQRLCETTRGAYPAAPEERALPFSYDPPCSS